MTDKSTDEYGPRMQAEDAMTGLELHWLEVEAAERKERERQMREQFEKERMRGASQFCEERETLEG